MLEKIGRPDGWLSKCIGTLIGIVLVIGSLSTGSKAVTKIEFWTNNTQPRRIAEFRSIAKAFQQKYPDYVVEVVPYGEEQEFMTKWAAAQMAGDLPEIVEAGEMWTAFKIIFDDLGLPEVAESVIKEIGEWDFFEFSLKVLTHKGAYHGVPEFIFSDGIWYRKDMFEEHGLEPFGEVVTFAELRNAAMKLNHPEKRVYGIVMNCAREAYVQYFNWFANAIGATVFDEHENIVVNSKKRDEWLELLSYWNELEKYTQPGPQAAGDPYTTFTAGNAAISVVASYMCNYIEEKIPSLRESIGVTWKVKNKLNKPVSYSLAGGFVPIRGMSPEQAEASKEWLKFFLTGKRRIGVLNLVYGGFNPVRKSVLYSDEYLNNPVRKKWGADFFVRIVEASQGAQMWGTLPDGTITTKIGNAYTSMAIQDARFNVCQRGIDPEEALATMEKKLKQAVGE